MSPEDRRDLETFLRFLASGRAWGIAAAQTGPPPADLVALELRRMALVRDVAAEVGLPADRLEYLIARYGVGIMRAAGYVRATAKEA